MWLLAFALLAPSPKTIYVAVDGNDSWSGRVVRPNRARTDGPLRTIQAGQQQARKTAAFRISIEAGRYRLSEPLRLTAEDSDRLFDAYHGGPVEICGSRQISGWTIDSKGWWHTSLAAVRAGDWNFIQLWVNGERRFRPRATGDSYASIADTAEPSPQAAGKGFDGFVFKKGELSSAWHNLSDVEVLPVHNWTMGRLRIRSVDEATRIVRFTGHTASTADWSSLSKGNHYIIENVREALGKPGEWYLDRSSGELTYVPRPGEMPTTCDVEAPVAESLLVMDGVRTTGFGGLCFEFTNWVTPQEGHDFPQADIDIPAAITCTNCTSVFFAHCLISHTGGYAVEFGQGCQRSTFVSSTGSDLGGGGVRIGTMLGTAGTGSAARVFDSRFVSGGRLHPAAVGVWIGDASGNDVENNEIRDFYYTGVSVGWTWGYGPAHSGNNMIAHNEISNIGQHVLSDMGGIYTLGDQTGTHLAGNVIHDVTCFAYGGWGIYPDEGTTNEVITNNIVYKCQSAGFHQHYGKNNLIRNNIFALNGDYEVMRTRAEDHLSFTFDHNIIAWAGGQPFGSNWSGSGFLMKNNLYWHYAGLVSSPTQEPAGLVADPMFVDPVHGNFQLKPGSPAFGLGFELIDVSGVGPHGKDAPAPVKPAPRAFPDPFAKP